MRGCYNWFRPPRTKYEIWMEKHERNRMKRLLEEAEQEIWLGRVWNILFYRFIDYFCLFIKC